MGWRPEERSSSDVGQWTTLLRRLLGHFAISTTSVECYGLSHACFYLRLSSNVTTRVWIDNLYHIKPGKYHGVGTLSKIYLFVAILENGRHLGFSIDQSDGMDLITIEMSHANFGACIVNCTIHPKNANYLLHSESVTTCPDGNVTTCPNVISLTKFAIVENTVYLTSSDLYTRLGILT